LLFEKNLEKLFDAVILVKSKQEIACQRAMEKFSLTRKEAKKRLKAYIAVSKKIKKSDFIVENNSTLKDLSIRVNGLWNKLVKTKFIM